MHKYSRLLGVSLKAIYLHFYLYFLPFTIVVFFDFRLGRLHAALFAIFDQQTLPSRG
jgi:hypothetical protein